MTTAIVVALLLAGGQTAEPPKKPDLATISARLGMCTADFTVADADGKPVYAATVHVRIRYGFMSLKRMDLEVGTNSDGKARVEGLPLGGRRLTYDITKDTRKTTVEQDLTKDCHAMYMVTLK
ncbi:MAG: hypothetical protein HYU37_17680 [Acidobacteria bacterium]|nr:hypothetical protein [Acidobacteriota bacterium]